MRLFISFVERLLIESNIPIKPKILDECLKSFEQSIASHLSLISALHLKLQHQPDFEWFNQRIRALKDCFCYEDLLVIDLVKASEYFKKLCQNPTTELGSSLLNFIKKHQIVISEHRRFLEILTIPEQVDCLKLLLNEATNRREFLQTLKIETCLEFASKRNDATFITKTLNFVSNPKLCQNHQNSPGVNIDCNHFYN
jgi:hypothetical protein